MFSREQKVAMGILLAMLATGVFLSVFSLTCFIRYHWGHFKPKSQIAPFFLILMSGFLSLNTCIIYVAYFVNDGLAYHWCQYHGVAIMLAAGGTVYGHVLLAFERYYVVIKEKPITWTFIITGSILQMIYALFVVCLQLLHTRHGYIPMESGIWCFYNWTEVYFGDRLISIILISMAFFQSSLINYAYFSVYLKTRQITQDIIQHKKSLATPSQQSDKTARPATPYEKKS